MNTDRATLLTQLADLADQLCDPRQHTERIRTWDHNRNDHWRTHTTTQPGLLAQLHHAAIDPSNPDTGTHTRGALRSRPPLALEALSRHAVITIAATRWAWSMRLPVRDTVESNIRALVGAAANLDPDDTQLLLSEMRQWQRWCAVLTGWETLYQPAHVTCPIEDCQTRNSLRINLTNTTAMCRACGAAWDGTDGSIAALADHIRIHTEGNAA